MRSCHPPPRHGHDAGWARLKSLIPANAHRLALLLSPQHATRVPAKFVSFRGALPNPFCHARQAQAYSFPACGASMGPMIETSEAPRQPAARPDPQSTA
ncbi:hypothetical protein CHELA17_61196 [Chelatococcus asaccharovorans]|nr:hypothetical protein CHELA17_61196 [Chelatococcus asaccharovorans]